MVYQNKKRVEIKKMIDKSNMRQTILDFPGQFKIGLEAAKSAKLKGKFDSIVVCGMGGSAMGAEILESWMEENDISFPVLIHRDYGLPEKAGKKSLVICVSNSGSTEETLSTFNLALRRNLPLLALGSGGRLIEECKKNNVPFSLMPKGYQTRMTLGFQFSSLLKIASNCGVLPDKSKELASLGKTLNPASLEAEGKRIAKKIRNRIPIIYSSSLNKNLAEIWKINFNENSKVPSFFNVFPEMNHNEMAGYSFGKKGASPFFFLMLEDIKDQKRIKERMDLTCKILEKRGGECEILKMKDKNFLRKFFSSVILSYWASWHLALMKGADPSELKIVEEFKKELR